MVCALITVSIAIALLPSADGRMASSLRAQRAVETSGRREGAATHVAALAQISATAKVSSAVEAGTSTKFAKAQMKKTSHADSNGTAFGQAPLMDGISAMRAEMCAHQKSGVSDEHDECLEFMTGACNPGPDMLMNGTPGEVSTGKGFCTEFFNPKTHAASPAAPPGAPGAPGPAPAVDDHNLGDVHAENQIDFPAEEDRQVSVTMDMEATMEEVSMLMKVRSSSVDEKKEELAALYWYEEELQEKLKGLDDDAYCDRVQQEAALVANETTAPELSNMLGEMRCEMQRLSLPFYKKVVERNIAMVQQQQKTLMQEIELEKKNRTKTIEEEELAEVEEKAEALPEEKKVEEKLGRFERWTGVKYSWDMGIIAIVIALSICVCVFGKIHRS